MYMAKRHVIVIAANFIDGIQKHTVDVRKSKVSSSIDINRPTTLCTQKKVTINSYKIDDLK